MNKPTKGKAMLNCQVEDWQLREIDEIAEGQGTDRSSVVRGALYKTYPSIVPRRDTKPKGKP